jgi:hypothetical protein
VWNEFAFARELIAAVVIFVGVPLAVGQLIVSWRIQLKKAGVGRTPIPSADLSHQMELFNSRWMPWQSKSSGSPKRSAERLVPRSRRRGTPKTAQSR